MYCTFAVIVVFVPYCEPIDSPAKGFIRALHVIMNMQCLHDCVRDKGIWSTDKQLLIMIVEDAVHVAEKDGHK